MSDQQDLIPDDIPGDRDDLEEVEAEDGETLGFAAAMERLEEILRRIESEQIDIDELGTELKRATALLELCRGKIRRAEVEVNQILENLE